MPLACNVGFAACAVVPDLGTCDAGEVGDPAGGDDADDQVNQKETHSPLNRIAWKTGSGPHNQTRRPTVRSTQIRTQGFQHTACCGHWTTATEQTAAPIVHLEPVSSGPRARGRAPS